MQVKLILLALLIGGVAFVTWDYFDTKQKNKELTAQVEAGNTTIKKLDEKAGVEAAISRDSETILEEVRNAPDTDDGPVAPVLDRTIDRIDGLHNAADD